MKAKILFWLLLGCTVVCPAVTVGLSDPEEGGLGGTGHSGATRPEGIDRPELPERVEPIERPDVEFFDPTEALELDGIGNESPVEDMPQERPSGN